MHRSTLHLAVYLFDRFLSVTDLRIDKDDLQIIGVSCLLIAGKTEEISPPSLRSYAEMTDYLCHYTNHCSLGTGHSFDTSLASGLCHSSLLGRTVCALWQVDSAKD